MPPPIKKLADKFLSNPKTIEVARPATAAAGIDQRMIRVDARRKKDAIEKLLRSDEVRTAIVFCNRKTTVRELAQQLKRDGFAAGQIHGDMEQPERLRELDRFKNEEINILVASDVAARGLDIKGVSHVFNYDVPWHPDDYVHRIGRTGRAGRAGVSITLVGKDDAESIENIQKLIGTTIAEMKSGARSESRGEEQASERAPSAEPAPKPEQKSRRGERRPAAAAKPAPPRQEVREPAAADEGWNGPVPSFLGQGFGS
jgi:superfamily II DNA/RNA helicase